MPTTLKDLAAYCGLHPSTISRILRGKDSRRISKATQQKVFDAAKKLHYQPNQIARALRLKKTNTIGLIVPDISNPFFSRIAHTIDNLAYDAAYMLIVVSTDENQHKEYHFVEEMVSRGVDGLMIIPVQEDDKHLRELQEEKFPLVLMDREFEKFETNVILSDNKEASYNAVKHLYKLGHKRIAVLSGRRDIYSIKERIQGYMDAVKDLKVDNDPRLIKGNGHRIEDGYAATKELLNLPKPPTALLISGNLITVGALEAIREKNLQIPKDISVIGFTDSLYSDFLSTPLSTISHPLQEIGEKSINLLFKHINSEKQLPYEKIIVKTKFTARDSIGPAA